MAESRDYDAQVQDINLEEITSCERNANILRELRDGDPNFGNQLFVVDEENDDGDPDEFVVGEGDDLGWLGYFIAHSGVIDNLYIYYLLEGGDQINAFFDGMSRNRSIKSMVISCEIGVDGWNRLGGFLGNNHNLSQLEFQGIMIGPESAQNLALALGQMNHNSLKGLTMNDTGISDEDFVEIAAALRLHPQLETLELFHNNIGRDGCIALGNTLSRWPASNELETLRIDDNIIDDEGIQALAEGLMNCHSLKQLDFEGNQSITAAGLRSLFPLFQSESHCLEKLYLKNINFGDDGAIALAEGLKGNESLKKLYFDNVAGITVVGWSAFSRLLCDTSTINNTYLSNHTLTTLGDYQNEGTPQDIKRLLSLNIYQDAAMYKILQSHPDLDMEPFFKLKMKFLPAVISWFERVEPIEDALVTSYDHISESERSCKSRKLSALYKFVRGMPDLTIIGYWEGRMIHIEAERRRLAGEMRRLDDEEDITRKRLGLSGQPIDEASASRNKRMRLE